MLGQVLSSIYKIVQESILVTTHKQLGQISINRQNNWTYL